MTNQIGNQYGNDGVVEPFQPLPTAEKWTPQDKYDNRSGTVIRTGLYLKDRKANDSKIEIIADAIDEEIEERKQADSALDERVTTLEEHQGDVDAWKQPLADEITARENGDKDLSDKILAETQARSAADDKLKQDLNTETTDRINGDIQNSTNLQNLVESLGTAAYADMGTQPGEVVEIGSDGKISDSILPATVVNNTYVVDSEAEMLALPANVGDIAVRTDTSETYILQKEPSTTLDDWVLITSHFDGVSSFNGQKGNVTYTAPVSSVNGKTGAIVLRGSDIAVSTSNTDTIDVALGKKVDTGGTIDKANTLATPRDLKVDLGSSLAESFDGSADAVGIGVSGTLPISRGGTGNTDGTATSLTMIDVQNDTDLNTIVTPGLYVNRSNTTTGITNVPDGATTNFFMMEVYATSIRTVMQRYWDSVGKLWFIRGSSGNPSTFSPWVEVGAGAGGTGSIIYGGQFRFGSTNFTGADTLTIRATGAVDNIKGNDSNIVTADPENGVALFTNPTSKPITVILNTGFTLNRTSGTADTLPKKFNIVPVNADIGGGLTDESHLSDTGSVQLTAGGLGATNRNVISPSYFTIPANGTFRLSYSIDGYGAMADTYTTQATMNYVAFRQDAKTQTEQINIPWTPLTGANGGTVGEYKKIGSWTVLRWNITSGTTAGNYGLGTIPDVDARPVVGFMSQVANQTGTGSQTFHLQINQKDGSGAGAITILNATASTNFRGQVVFNNDSAETVSVPLLADYDINLPNNSITVGQIVDGLGIKSVIDPDDGVYVAARDVRTAVAPDGLVISDLDDSGNPTDHYRWNTVTGTALRSDVAWNTGFTMASGWQLRGTSDVGFMIRNGNLFVNINAFQTQNALTINSNTLMGTVPSVSLFGITRVECAVFPGTSNRLNGYLEINSTGQIHFHNYDAIPAQTGSNYNIVRGYFNVPIKLS